MSIRHNFVSGFSDSGDDTQLQPSDWNDVHVLTGGNDGDVLMRDSGATEGATWTALAEVQGGDVNGPTGATASNFAGFDGATGKLLKDSGSKAADFAAAVHIHDGLYMKRLPNVLDNQLAAFDGTSGGKVKDSGIAASAVALTANAATDHNHDAAYAPIAKGVTNGDTHDHRDGDGGQINHTTLAAIGTHSHAAIDTHLDSIANPHSVTGDQVLPAQTGKSGKYLTTNGTTVSWDTPPGAGDAVGPGSSTADNFVAFSDTGGKTLKDSGKKAADFADASHTHLLAEVTDLDTVEGADNDFLVRTSGSWTNRTPAQARAQIGLDKAAITYHDSAPENGTVCLCLRSPVAATIDSATHQMTSGTVAVAVKINTTAVTGLTALSPATKATTNATAANTIAVGDEINVTFSSASSPVGFDLAINLTI